MSIKKTIRKVDNSVCYLFCWWSAAIVYLILRAVRNSQGNIWVSVLVRNKYYILIHIPHWLTDWLHRGQCVYGYCSWRLWGNYTCTSHIVHLIVGKITVNPYVDSFFIKIVTLDNYIYVQALAGLYITLWSSVLKHINSTCALTFVLL